MKITISHGSSKDEVMKTIDRSFDELFQGGAAKLPVRISVEQRSWQGSVLSFALKANMGLLSTPIKGTIEVTERDLTIDADLGLLNRFVSEKTAQEMIGDRIKGLLH